jgi:hypothetical protein
MAGARVAVTAMSLVWARVATPQTADAVPRQLTRPSYPSVAVSAMITGTVEVVVEVASDGHILSAVAISGLELLRASALNAARLTTFECHECADVTIYRIVYSFQFASGFKPVRDDEQPPPEIVGPEEARVTVLAEAPLVEPYFTDRSVHAAKCAYLWRCGRHWSGLDYYYYRVRAARCGWLCHCGYELKEFYKQYERDHPRPSRV